MNVNFQKQDKVIRARNKAWLAWLLWTLSGVLFLGYIALRVAVNVALSHTETTIILYPIEQSQMPVLHFVGDVLLFLGYLAFSTLGALIVVRHPENRIGWIFCAIGFIQALSEFASYYAIYALVIAPGSLPGGLAAGWLQNWLIALTTGLLVIFTPLLFPNGQLLSRRWAGIAWLGVGTIALLSVLLAFYPSLLTNTSLAAMSNPLEGFTNPLGIKAIGDLLPSIAPIGNGLLLSSVFAAATSLILRLRRAIGDERQQIKWFAYIATLLVVVYVSGIPIKVLYLSIPSFYVVGKIAFAVWRIVTLIIGFLGLPLVAGIAILKYHLYDIDILINRTLVYGTLTIGIVGFYVLIVGGFGILFQAQSNLLGIIIALLLIAFLLQPLRRWLQSVVNRFVPMSRIAIEESSASQHSQNPQEVAIAEKLPHFILHGPWLALARICWVLISLIAVGLCIMALVLNTVSWWNFTEAQCYDRLVNTETSPQACIETHRAYEQVFGTIKLVAVYFLIGASIEMLPWALMAGLIFWRKSHEPFALSFSLCLLLVGTLIIDPFAHLIIEQSYPALFYVYRVLAFLGSALLVLWFRFPNGKFVPRKMRWIAMVWIPLGFFSTFLPDSPLDSSSWPEPLSLGIPAAFVLSLLISLIYRYRHVSGPLERQQIRWIVMTGAVFGCLFVGGIPLFRLAYMHQLFVAFPPLSVFLRITYLPLQYLSSALFAFGIGISILRYRFWDIDIFINRTLVYGALTGIVVSVFVVLVGFLSTLFQSSGNSMIAILATGFVALLFNPLRQRLQHGVNRLMYGERDDPYAVLSRLGQRLEAAYAPESVLPTIVETVAQTLKLPYVAIALNQGGKFKIAAEFGHSKNESISLPLIHQGEPIGELILARRAPGEHFTTSERQLLDDLARQAGVAAHAVRLTADL